MVVAHLANVGYLYEDTLQNDSGVIPVAVVTYVHSLFEVPPSSHH